MDAIIQDFLFHRNAYDAYDAYDVCVVLFARLFQVVIAAAYIREDAELSNLLSHMPSCSYLHRDEIRQIDYKVSVRGCVICSFLLLRTLRTPYKILHSCYCNNELYSRVLDSIKHLP